MNHSEIQPLPEWDLKTMSDNNNNHKECKSCELAVYCFSDSSTWTFRTMKEMDEKKAAISTCPIHQKGEQASGTDHGSVACGEKAGLQQDA